MRDFINSKKGKIVLVAIGVLVVAIGVLIALLLKNNAGGFRTISVSEIVGTAKVTHNGNEYDAYKDMKLQEGYTLKTGETSHVRMVLDEDKYIKLEENSKVVFETLEKEGSGRTSIMLEYGAVTNEAATGLQEDEEYIVNTPNTVLAIKGTFFRVNVREDANGDILTDVYTYGGVVKSQRILPTGKVVDENVLIEAGYKTTVSMDTKETIYIVEKVEEGKENTEPITIRDIPDGDLVDMYVAASNGHDMFIDAEEIWDEIEDRDIKVEEYTSNRDGKPVTPPRNDDNQGDCTEHTEEITTVEATCTENGYIKTECKVCGEVLSEVIIESTGHTEETIIEPATATEDGKTTIKCLVCGEIIQEIIIPANHTHTYETVTTDATCTVDGKTVTRCSGCLEVTKETLIPAKGHSTEEEIVQPTFLEAGSYHKFCSVCRTSLETKTLAKLDPLYTDDGNIYITPSGYAINTIADFVDYTGPYVISQRTAAHIESNIVVEGGGSPITIYLDGINMNGTLEVCAEANVILHGTEKVNYINNIKGDHSPAIRNTASLNIYSGQLVAMSTYNALEYTGTQMGIFGGSVTFDGSVYDISGDNLYFAGGSIRLVHDRMSGKAYNEGMELECVVYDYYPSNAEREYMLNGYSQTYQLKEDDVATDGKYYIWMPSPTIAIDANNFPDVNFRNYIVDYIDNNKDNVLSKSEITNTTVILIPQEAGEIKSLQGIRYFTELQTLQCDNAITFSSLDIRYNTKLEVLVIPGAPITSLNLLNTPNIKTLFVQDTFLTNLNLSNFTQLSFLNITNCPLAYVNLENTQVDSTSFTSGNNIYKATGLNSGTFDINTISGIDISKISNVTGADYDPATGIFTNITGTQLEYVYDCGNSIAAEFVIQFQ